VYWNFPKRRWIKAKHLLLQAARCLTENCNAKKFLSKRIIKLKRKHARGWDSYAKWATPFCVARRRLVLRPKTLPDRRTEWLTDWLTDWMTECSTDYITTWLSEALAQFHFTVSMLGVANWGTSNKGTFRELAVLLY
jgi:hypothetical protein